MSLDGGRPATPEEGSGRVAVHGGRTGKTDRLAILPKWQMGIRLVRAVSFTTGASQRPDDYLLRTRAGCAWRSEPDA